MKFKGPAWPSYFQQPNPPTPRTQWIAHSNTRAQLRNLRRVCRPILDATDAAIVTVRDRVFAATAGEPLPEFGALHLIYAAIEASDQTGEPWAVCMGYFLDKLETMAGPPIPMHAIEADVHAGEQ